MLGAKRLWLEQARRKVKEEKREKNENNVVSFVVAPLLTVEKEYK